MKKARWTKLWMGAFSGVMAIGWVGPANADRGPWGKRAPHDYSVVSYDTDAPSASLVRTTLTVQDGDAELNRFRVVRLEQSEQSECHRHRGRPLMLVSPFGFPVEFFQIEDEGGYESGFAQKLALSGYDVWLVDGRLADAQPGQCESGEVDCSVMEHWGMQTAVADVLFARTLVRFANPGKKPVVGGFSGGSSTALAAVNARPQQFDGLFLWEGTLVSFDPATQARNAAFCEADRQALASGLVYDGAVQGFKFLFEQASTAPNDPTPIPAFPPGTSNLSALLFPLTQPDATNPLNFTADFIRFVGDPAAQTLTYSKLSRVLEMGPLVGNYAPLAFIRDSHCAMGGLDTSFIDRLHKFRGRALIFAEGKGFNQMMLDTATALSRAEVTVDYQPDLAESDRYFHVDWDDLALSPLLSWLAFD